MTRTYAIRACVALFIGLFATLSTVRAGQMWTESQAQLHASSARQQAAADLVKARVEGLTGTNLETLKYRLHDLEMRRAPGSSVLWGGSRAEFFSRQATAFGAFRAYVKDVIGQAQATERRQVMQTLQRVDGLTEQARGLALDTSGAVYTATRLRGALSRASTVRALRRMVRSADVLASKTAKRNLVRHAQLTLVVSVAGNTVIGVQQAGEADIAAARSDLSLLSVFSRSASTFTTSLDSEEQSLQRATTPQSAAVSAVMIHDERMAVEAAFAHSVPDKVIVVSTEDQMANAYKNGKQVLSTPVTTGGPELPTGHGVFHIFEKISPFVFHSPFPLGSPYYYSPTPVQFWMPFDGNDGLHDASWRSNYGAGSNFQPTDLGNGNTILGTHGCVNMPYDAAQFIWNWAPLGTTVVVI